MIGKLMKSDGANAVLVLALSGTIAVLTANGPGRVSPARVLAGALSNPVPRRGKPGAGASQTGDAGRRTAA